MVIGMISQSPGVLLHGDACGLKFDDWQTLIWAYTAACHELWPRHWILDISASLLRIESCKSLVLCTFSSFFVPCGGNTPGWITAWAKSRALTFFCIIIQATAKDNRRRTSWTVEKKSVVCIATNHIPLSRWMTTKAMFKHWLEDKY